MSDTPPADHEAEGRLEALPPVEEESFEVADSYERVPPTDIIAYNEVRSCADLFRLYSSGKMEIQPDFQREIVWKKDERARFIDSLVKQLPIPSMCFSLDPRNQRWKVIDGLQRMTSIVDFLGDNEWRLAALDDIHPLLRGNTNVALRTGNEQSTILYSAVENVTVPVTVIRCDYSKSDHMRYLFTIFHRLNSGGIRLNNQEIRNCIYTGTFNDTLKKFDSGNADWQVIKSRIWGSVNRFRSVEILLRVLAFSESLSVYDGNLADFLNMYMQSRTNMSTDAATALSERLGDIARLSRRALQNSGPGKLSLATIEALLVGINNNLQRLMEEEDPPLAHRYEEMLTRPAFAEGARYAVSSVENVRARLGDAISSFKGDS
jgi:hypothetical protein